MIELFWTNSSRVLTVNYFCKKDPLWMLHRVLNTAPTNPASIFVIKVNNGNIRATCGICSKLTIKTPELWTYFTPGSRASIVNFEHEIACWEYITNKVLVRLHRIYNYFTDSFNLYHYLCNMHNLFHTDVTVVPFSVSQS